MQTLAPEPALSKRIVGWSHPRGVDDVAHHEPSSVGPPSAALLQRTFVHLRGVGLKTERRLWQGGVRSWSDVDTGRIRLPGPVLGELEQSRRALEAGDVAFFFRRLPASERWRTFTNFAGDFLAVDIETTGMSTVYDEITTIGIDEKGRYRAYVRGVNLEEAAEPLARARGLITYNGSLFDLPFLRRAFPDVPLTEVHLDLRFLSRRIGYSGSLKHVEGLAGLARPEGIGDITGREAVLLWDEFSYGELDAIARLVVYNAADTLVLRPLAAQIVEELRIRLERQARAAVNGDCLFDPDADLCCPRKAQVVPSVPRVRRRGGTLHIARDRLDLRAFRRPEPTMSLAALRARMADPDCRMVGIDLSGSARRPTGWALLQGDAVITGLLDTTEDIVRRTLSCRPSLVSIDSPLSLPEGRDCTDDRCPCRAVGGITRHCERELKRRGVNVYPCLIQSMQALTARGIDIARQLRDAGVPVIESYPGAAQDIMRIPRKRAGLDRLRDGLERFGIRGIRSASAVSHDELDAVTSAAVGAFYLADMYEPLGTEQEDYLIIPAVSPEPGETFQSVTSPPMHMVFGDDTAAAAERLEAAHCRWSRERPSSDTRVLLGNGWEAWWEAVAAFGPRLRAALITAERTRVPKRTPFVDLVCRVDDPALDETLRNWMGDWDAAARACL